MNDIEEQWQYGDILIIIIILVISSNINKMDNFHSKMFETARCGPETAHRGSWKDGEMSSKGPFFGPRVVEAALVLVHVLNSQRGVGGVQLLGIRLYID